MKPFKKLVSKHNVIYFKELPLAVKVEYEPRKAHWITFTLEDNLKMFEDEILKTQHQLRKDGGPRLARMNKIIKDCIDKRTEEQKERER